MAAARLPEYLPIVRQRAARADYRRRMPKSSTTPADLCVRTGVSTTRPSAGRARRWCANLRGHWPRRGAELLGWLPAVLFLGDPGRHRLTRRSARRRSSFRQRAVAEPRRWRDPARCRCRKSSTPAGFRSAALEYTNAIDGDHATGSSPAAATGERIEAIHRPPPAAPKA
jgi:hypothetical protein